MQDRNPYATPRANVTRGDDAVEEYGEVRLFAVSGRIGRVRYIAYSIALSLLVLLAAVILGVLAAVVDQNAALAVVGFAYLVVYAIQLLPGIQRAHDMNVSGWLSLISLIPLGALVFWLVPGTRGENTYGKPPPPNGAGVILVACLLPLTFFGGVLAAIAVPAYQDYTLRAQVSEGLSLAGGVKVAVAETFERTGAAPVDRLEAGLSADPMDTAGLYVDSVDVAKGTIVVTYGANANAAIAGSSLALRPYLMPDKRVAWRCGQGPVPEGAVAMDANATRFTTDMMPVHLPSACRP